MIDYTNMSGPDLLAACRDDATKWAKAFCQTYAKLYSDGITPGEDWVAVWFANAIEHSYDVRTDGAPVVPQGERLPDNKLTGESGGAAP